MACRKPTATASSAKNITAIVSSVTTSDSRQCTGFRCATVPSAEIIASTAKKTNTPSVISVSPRGEHHHDRGYHEIGEAQRDQSLPSQAHQLVVTQPRQSPTDQNLQPAEDHCFDHERDYAQDRD